VIPSPHTVELNAEAFKRCSDLMIQSAIAFQAELQELIVDLETTGVCAGPTGVYSRRRLGEPARHPDAEQQGRHPKPASHEIQKHDQPDWQLSSVAAP
jgi:hypothetical protein